MPQTKTKGKRSSLTVHKMLCLRLDFQLFNVPSFTAYNSPHLNQCLYLTNQSQCWLTVESHS